MNGIIPELLVNLHLTYVEEEVCSYPFWTKVFFSTLYDFLLNLFKNLFFFAARAEISEFIEYDLDSEDEDWLQNLNSERRILPPEK